MRPTTAPIINNAISVCMTIVPVHSWRMAQSERLMRKLARASVMQRSH